MIETVRPPAPRLPLGTTAWRWSRANLFSSPANTALTVFMVVLLSYAGYQAGRFVLLIAEWDVITANRGLFMVGRFPREEVWRVWVVLHVASALAGISWGAFGRVGPRLAGLVAAVVALVYVFLLEGDALILTATCLIAFAAAYGAAHTAPPEWNQRIRSVLVLCWLLGFAFSMYMLSEVPDRLWGGLLLTMILAIVGIVASFPLGVALAVGRASSFPVIRLFCVGYIELMRGVPLITVLFMFAYIAPFAFGPGRDVLGVPVTGYVPSAVGRAMIGLTLFTAAYIAEIVRGGLQAVPRGQVEAGQALGLGGVRVLALIVLPQALRAVIPALVSQFITLFKDTSLVFILALTDLLAVARVATAQPVFVGRQAEVLLFAALLYWIVAFSMSRASQQLERNLGVGER
jgi:general L-amino acid transport system permease protein